MQTRVPRWAIEGLKRTPVAYRQAVRARRALGIVLGARAVDGVPGRVHRNDTMIDGTDPTSVASYVSSGTATVTQLLGIARARVGPPEHLHWMELGCGYGRLLRHLVATVDPAQVTASDIDPRAVAFCARELGVHGVPSGRAAGPVDVLYAVSVISHLDWEGVRDVVRFALRTVRPGGLALLSTHGPSTLRHLEVYGPGWPEKRGEIEAALASTGHAFLPYPSLGRAYGLAWHEPGTLVPAIHEVGGGAVADVEVLERGVEDHQDLYVIQRAS